MRLLWGCFELHLSLPRVAVVVLCGCCGTMRLLWGCFDSCIGFPLRLGQLVRMIIEVRSSITMIRYVAGCTAAAGCVSSFFSIVCISSAAFCCSDIVNAGVELPAWSETFRVSATFAGFRLAVNFGLDVFVFNILQ